ncbi:hypothetical protein, partial [Pseudomonas fluorescens]
WVSRQRYQEVEDCRGFLTGASDGQGDIRRACGVTQLGAAQGHGQI